MLHLYDISESQQYTNRDIEASIQLQQDRCTSLQFSEPSGATAAVVLLLYDESIRILYFKVLNVVLDAVQDVVNI